MSTNGRWSGVVAAAIPVAAAIGVFGLVYGATARPVLGTRLTIASSVVVFSGAAQFTLVGLLAAGAGAGAALGAVAVLALRHLPLGAVVRPRLQAGRVRRAALSLFLLDETTGLALALDAPAERTLVVGGGLAWVAWVVGTAVGAAGGDLPSIEPLAAAIFPVLFVGLASLTATTREDGARAVIAGVATVLLLLAWPGAGAVGALVVAIGVATVGRES